MKSIFSKILLLFVVSAMIFAQKVEINTDYDQPAFDNPKAVLFDVEELRVKGSSKVTVVNYTDYRTLAFEAFVHSPISQQWESLGRVNLLAFADRVVVGNKYPDLKKMRYFAIVPNAKDADKNFICVPTTKNRKMFANSIVVEVRRPEDDINLEPKPSLANEPNAYVMGESEIPDDVDEDIYIKNWTSQKAISVSVFGYSKKELKWIPLGSTTAKASFRELEMGKYKIRNFYNLAFVVPGNKRYNYGFQNKRDNLYVSVSDTPD